MKYLPSALAVLLGCGAVGMGLWFTENPNCLWALILVGIMAESLYPQPKNQDK